MTLNSDATTPTLRVSDSKQRRVRVPYLERTEGVGAPQRLTLKQSELIIGRAEEANIQIASQRASRQHAILSQHGTDFFIRDNDSRNGVFLNGVKVHSAVLRDGDILQMADSLFVYYEG